MPTPEKLNSNEEPLPPIENLPFQKLPPVVTDPEGPVRGNYDESAGEIVKNSIKDAEKNESPMAGQEQDEAVNPDLQKAIEGLKGSTPEEEIQAPPESAPEKAEPAKETPVVKEKPAVEQKPAEEEIKPAASIKEEPKEVLPKKNIKPEVIAPQQQEQLSPVPDSVAEQLRKAGIVSEMSPPLETEMPESAPAKEEKQNVVEAVKQTKEQAAEFLSDEKLWEKNPREIIEAFRTLTENEKGEHRHLAKERNEMAYENERERKRIVLIGKEAIENRRQELIKKAEAKIHEKERLAANATCWERLAPKQKEKFKTSDSPEFKKYLEDKRNKLGVSEDAFASLVQKGYKPEDAKVRRWGTWFRGPALEIPSTISDTALTSDGSKDDLNKWVEDNHNAGIRERVAQAVEDRLMYGRKVLLQEKRFCAKEIIRRAVDNYKEEQNKKKRPEPVPTEAKAVVAESEKPVNYNKTASFFNGLLRSFSKELKSAEKKKDVKGIKKINAEQESAKSIVEGLGTGDATLAEKKLVKMILQNQRELGKNLSKKQMGEKLKYNKKLTALLKEVRAA